MMTVVLECQKRCFGRDEVPRLHVTSQVVFDGDEWRASGMVVQRGDDFANRVEQRNVDRRGGDVGDSEGGERGRGSDLQRSEK